MFDALDAFDAKEKVLFLSLLMLTALLLCLAWLGAVHQPRVDMMPMFVPCPTLSYPCLMAMHTVLIHVSFQECSVWQVSGCCSHRLCGKKADFGARMRLKHSRNER
jgi:hypothetical protein